MNFIWIVNLLYIEGGTKTPIKTDGTKEGRELS
jgi:hypothetical protein